jgi:hypothetical protein
MAQALGARVVLVTGLHPGYDQASLAGLDLYEVPVASNPRYSNSYDSFGNRTQHLLDKGTAPANIDWDELPAADVFILAPAYHEFPAVPPVNARITGVSLQGALRTCDDEGRVSPTDDPASACLPFAAPGSFLFLSEEDTHRPEALARVLVEAGATVLLTRGYRGATLYHGDVVAPHAAIPTVRMVDPTGAGDCFATAFVVRYAETEDLDAAMRFALTAGALAVEGDRLDGIPTREAIEERMRQVAA